MQPGKEAAKTASECMKLPPKEELQKIIANKNLIEVYGDAHRLVNLLQSSLTHGLNNEPDNIATRQRTYGINHIEPKEQARFYVYFFRALADKILICLCFVALLTIILAIIQKNYPEIIDGVAIIFAVLIVSFTSSICDYKKDGQFRALQESIKTSNHSLVLRNATVVEVLTKEVVVGDILCLKYGDQLVPDCILVEGNDLKMDESSITGETDLVSKDMINDPYLNSGTYVMEGSGKALVTCVGIYSQAGQIMALLEGNSDGNLLGEANANVPKGRSHKNESVLQKNLAHLAVIIGKVGMAVGIVVMIILIIHYCVKNYVTENRNFHTDDLRVIFNHINVGLSIIIVAVPEGLPLAVTLALAFSVKRMMYYKNLVRHLYSCETMGNATTICSDKTGTLTTNRMTVTKVYVEKKLLSIVNQTRIDLSPDVVTELIMNVKLNKNPTSVIEPSKVPGGFPSQLGNKTECALLGFLEHINHHFEDISETCQSNNVLKVWPFNSETKKMITLVKVANNKVKILVKGASEILLNHCSSENVGSVMLPIDYRSRQNILSSLNEMASQGLRTILLCSHDWSVDENKMLEIQNMKLADIEKIYNESLQFICVFGIEDPVRDDVPNAINQFKRAGITVRMVTGDNINTAISIAKKCGIIGGNFNGQVMDGKTFNALIKDEKGRVSQEKLDIIWPDLRVLARSTPQDKYTLVNGIIESRLKKNREVVAVTGDGTNDAPALRRADVGFSMGITGTDVAKQASDIIITNDSLASIVYSILVGRGVYDGICKFIQFQLTVNAAAIIVSTITTVFLGKVIFRSIQMLWLNLVMDTLASLALATDKPDDSLLNRPPYGRNKPLLSGKMIRFIAIHSVYQVAVIILLIFTADTLFGVENKFVNSHADDSGHSRASEHATVIFNVFVLMQIFNELNARDIHGERNVFHGITQNNFFVAVFITTLILQILFVQLGGRVFGVSSLSFRHWSICMAVAASELVLHQIQLCFPHRKLMDLIGIKKSKTREEVFHVTERETLPILIGYSDHSGNYVANQDVKQSDTIDDIDISDSTNQQQHRGKLLWLRGINRIRNQMRVVRAFQAAIEQPSPRIRSSILIQSNSHGIVGKDENNSFALTTKDNEDNANETKNKTNTNDFPDSNFHSHSFNSTLSPPVLHPEDD